MFEQPYKEMIDLVRKWGKNKESVAKAAVELTCRAKELNESLIYMNKLLMKIICLMGCISVFWLIWMLMIVNYPPASWGAS